MASSESNQKAKQSGAISALELCSGGIESEPWRLGRRLTLKFIGGNHPELDRIQCRWSESSQTVYWQQGDSKNPMSWTKVPQALALIFLDYLSVKEEVGPTFFCGARNGSLAASLGDAISQKGGRLHELLMEWLPKGIPTSRVAQVFDGRNIHGKEEGERRIFVRDDFLPSDCIEVYWGAHSPGRITKVKVLGELARRIRKSLGIPVEAAPQVGEGAIENKAPPAPPQPTPPKQPEPPRVEPEPTVPTQPPPPPAETFQLGKWLAEEFGQALKSLQEQTKQRRATEDPAKARRASAKESSQKVDVAGKNFAVEAKGQREPEMALPSEPPLAEIDPEFFEIQNPRAEEWLDSEGLVNFGYDDSDLDVWRIRDASEGVLILGAVGSGKTSSSGSLIATQYLNVGYGGLVLTAKPDEAKRWLRLCERAGRMDDCIHVTPYSGHKLNILQYEFQRPAKRVAITDDLIALFRCLIGVMSRSRDSGVKDDFWSNATQELMRNMFEIFLLSGEPFTIHRFIRFLNLAPKQPTDSWQSIEYFGELITRAGAKAREGTRTDMDSFSAAFEYWTKTFPTAPDVTRGGYMAGFTAMASVLTGRGIHEIIGTETNLTPEMILSGKIVILDFPIKESVQGGSMVQAAWKLLFQQAIERRADKNQTTARPVFLWEDEGHMTFSQYDVNFQPTARDCRASHVIISQNLHNFLHLGHDLHAVQAVFSAINTYVFHTNGDHATNCWASERIGELREKVLHSSGLLRDTPDEDISLFSRRPDEVKSVGGLTIREKRERAIPPEDFGKLKRGGDGTCQAVIFWLGHQFAINRNRNYCVKVFQQEPR